jgi:hypothetical protein
MTIRHSVANRSHEASMSLGKLWTLRVAAILGCLSLFAGSVACATVMMSRSWRDLDDANVRMHVMRIHGFDWDFIWSVIAFVTIAVSVIALFMCCAWMFWILLSHWDMSTGKDEKRANGRTPNM